MIYTRMIAAIGSAAMISVAALSCATQAEDFPSGPIEVINNSKPGGGSDIFLRFATEKAADILGTEFIHQSKTGGVSTNTLKYVSSRPADGHTLLIVNAGTMLTMMRGTVDLALDDIEPLVRSTIDPNFVVVKAGRYADAARFIEAAQNNTIKQAGTKVGGNPHVNALLFRNAVGMKKQVYEPFEKSGEIVINLINGNVDRGAIEL
ncbi:MAG: tripartite tricarboxylate transporter substrate-binding protein [Albidovulum sp.]|nr:tripartite tricarboxylate transporter substrate-binding protein [Albidovulum sp.]MDE0305199.1 tripartite tricarboxylate transporter substrate-binding protein [Albidovulum sp.]